MFHKAINPDFFYNMVQYAISVGKQNPEAAAAYFNLGNYLIESVLIAFLEGIIISFILAGLMRSTKVQAEMSK